MTALQYRLAAKSENARSAESLWQKRQKAFTCTNKSCGAALWKESKLYGNELDVDADIAKTLLSGKTVKATIQNKERTGTQDVEVGIEPYTAPNGRKYIGLCIMKTK